VLAAHNYLKNIKYQGVHDFHVGKPFPEKQGSPASHLASWREGSNLTPAGVYDKIGPLYHIFAAMTAEVWFPTQFGGDIAVNGEALLRTFQLIGDHPDMQKALADGCGENAGQWLRDNPPSEEQEGLPPGSSDTGSKDGSGSWHGAECDEAEGTYIYRWAVNLMKDPKTGLVKGTVKFLTPRRRQSAACDRRSVGGCNIPFEWRNARGPGCALNFCTSSSCIHF
jgi:hypothetical protein